MLRMVATVSLLLMPSAVLAGDQFCNDDVPYYVEKIPFGYAVVRSAMADYCSQDATDSELFSCNGDSGYQIDISLSEDSKTLIVRGTEFYACDMNHDT
ncbi:MAG: hypothetical protein NXI27_25965 [Alphaproteobacteria bacterium]|nr:hypothetical protein [Alphaproteobacteria bacterium]